VGMIPEKRLGLVILSNSNLTELVGALMMRIFDQLSGNPESDWSARVLSRDKKLEATSRAVSTKLEASRVTGTRPPLELGQYAGNYEDELYGTVTLSQEAEKLVLRFPDAQVADLVHWHYDVFRLVLRGPSPYPRFVRFQTGSNGL